MHCAIEAAVLFKQKQVTKAVELIHVSMGRAERKDLSPQARFHGKFPKIPRVFFSPGHTLLL